MRVFPVFALALLSSVFAAASDYTDSVLTNLQGVGLELRPLNIQSDLFDLTYEDVESHALATLEEYDVRLLTPMEQDVMPGQPYLEVSIDIAHAQGPSHLYVVRLELREMAQLERPRDRVVSMAVATWERKMMGVANRPEAITEVLDRLLRMFADEYHSNNYEDE
ncbi:hypothetical protein [Pelagicoccus albus]|uniref:Uncharacterized protein n=1 Tax=Pelagicoccus albus TaxID=415222 RepID=A0A7X1B5C9_9BACT|nr:hypothetical protein [Pelagicoccus albus]MBC2605822.1 hypothetical protein [Pelagicoccus albus]